ncbi:MAG: right-handed parallel beta-helix repeat-containing protein [Planctomycetaceae bacterium]|jgi:hypothetical protein|nr:right-handed parallel beta-helix repeat-containing protein [Planctomycetaceae bacterium]
MLRSSFYFVMISVLLNGYSLSAKDVYVNNLIGNDNNLGQLADLTNGTAGPLKTIGRAIALSDQGDRIILASTPIPYKETICLFGKKQSGDEFTPFFIEGNGAILDGSDSLPIESWRYFGGNIFRFQPSNLTHFQLFEDGLPLKRVEAQPNAKTPPFLRQMEWCICSGFVYLCLENFKRPQDYRFSYSERTTGITVMQANNVRINNLVVQGFQIDGIAVVNNTKNVVFDNVIVRGNGRNGLTIGASSSVAVNYSLLGDNNTAQIDVAKDSLLLLFLSEIKGIDVSGDLNASTAAELTKFTQSAKIFNRGGLIQQAGAEQATSESKHRPKIENLWETPTPILLLQPQKNTNEETEEIKVTN